MRLIATCMASNECDIVEAFVRHNLGLLDALVVLDHASIDRTPEILKSLAQEGLPLVVLRDHERAFRQGERQTYLARRFLDELDADFCFILDADEFLKAASRAALEKSLDALPPGHHGLVTLQNYFGPQGASDNPNPVRRLTGRMREERGVARKVVLRRAFASQADAQVSLGNHAAVQSRDGRIEMLAHAPLQGAWLAHFPVRSPEQVARKALLGWLAHRLTRPELFQGPGKDMPASHWHDMFMRLARGELVVDSLLVEEAIVAYAGGSAGKAQHVGPEELIDDPLACAYELRYTMLQAPSPLATLAAWTDQLVTDVNLGAIIPRA
jgi:hypothetical protein